MEIYNDNSGYSKGTSLALTMNKVYAWMSLALALTAFVAWYLADDFGAEFSQTGELLYCNTGSLMYKMLSSGQSIQWVLIIAEVGLVWYLSARIMSLSFTTAATMFGIYSILNGVMLSTIFLVYDLGTIYAAFFATAGTFAVMSFVGYTTKKDLSGMGGLLTMLLIGLVVATLVNMFLKSEGLSTLLTYVGVFLFVGLTAYDTQKIKEMVEVGNMGALPCDPRNLGIIGALSLYLDFVNLFLYLLRLFGSRRD